MQFSTILIKQMDSRLESNEDQSRRNTVRVVDLLENIEDTDTVSCVQD